MRSDLKTGHTQKNTERAGQAEKALYLLNTISAITDRGNNAEVRRKKDGSLTANYAQTECQFRYCGTAIPFLTVRSTAR